MAGLEKRVSRFFSLEETQAIISQAKEPYSTFFALAAITGMRAGELVALKVSDIDLERGLIRVQRSAWYGKVQAPKSKASVRALPIPRAMVERLRGFLRAWKPNQDGFLFATRTGRPWSANNIVQRNLWPILDALEIPRCGLHAFRHSHASLLADLGVPLTVAQAQLGHTDPRLTLAVYSHIIGDAHRAAIEKMGSVLDPVGLTSASASKMIQ